VRERQPALFRLLPLLLVVALLLLAGAAAAAAAAAVEASGGAAVEERDELPLATMDILGIHIGEGDTS
jgi:hypothetical protein